MTHDGSDRYRSTLSSTSSFAPSRRGFFGALAAGAAVLSEGVAHAADSLVARPPAGFSPLALPGKIV